jgi:hypothetical protein
MLVKVVKIDKIKGIDITNGITWYMPCVLTFV